MRLCILILTYSLGLMNGVNRFNDAVSLAQNVQSFIPQGGMDQYQNQMGPNGMQPNQYQNRYMQQPGFNPGYYPVQPNQYPSNLGQTFSDLSANPSLSNASHAVSGLAGSLGQGFVDPSQFHSCGQLNSFVNQYNPNEAQHLTPEIRSKIRSLKEDFMALEGDLHGLKQLIPEALNVMDTLGQGNVRNEYDQANRTNEARERHHHHNHHHNHHHQHHETDADKHENNC